MSLFNTYTNVCDKVNDMLWGTGTCKDISFSLPGTSLPVKSVYVWVGGGEVHVMMLELSFLLQKLETQNYHSQHNAFH